MEIQYVIINFIILLTILVIAGRKTVKRIFGGRLEKINKELDEAEAIEKMEIPVFESLPEEPFNEDFSEEIIKTKALTEEKINSIKAFGEREHSEIHRVMIENARKELFSVLKENVIKLFSYEKYANEIKELDEQVIDAILAEICLTPGDMAYLKHHDVLYVTLTSAFPLEKDLVEKVNAATTKLLESVGGKTSLCVLEDSSLIGGLKLRIGDTVYDGTVIEELYQFEKNLNHAPIMDDDTVMVFKIKRLSEAENSDILDRSLAIKSLDDMTAEELEESNNYNYRLLAKVVVDPVLTEDEWRSGVDTALVQKLVEQIMKVLTNINDSEIFDDFQK